MNINTTNNNLMNFHLKTMMNIKLRHNEYTKIMTNEPIVCIDTEFLKCNFNVQIQKDKNGEIGRIWKKPVLYQKDVVVLQISCYNIKVKCKTNSNDDYVQLTKGDTFPIDHIIYVQFENFEFVIENMEYQINRSPRPNVENIGNNDKFNQQKQQQEEMINQYNGNGYYLQDPTQNPNQNHENSHQNPNQNQENPNQNHENPQQNHDNQPNTETTRTENHHHQHEPHDLDESFSSKNEYRSYKQTEKSQTHSNGTTTNGVVLGCLFETILKKTPSKAKSPNLPDEMSNTKCSKLRVRGSKVFDEMDDEGLMCSRDTITKKMKLNDRFERKKRVFCDQDDLSDASSKQKGIESSNETKMNGNPSDIQAKSSRNIEDRFAKDSGISLKNGSRLIEPNGIRSDMVKDHSLGSGAGSRIGTGLKIGAEAGSRIGAEAVLRVGAGTKLGVGVAVGVEKMLIEEEENMIRPNPELSPRIEPNNDKNNNNPKESSSYSSSSSTLASSSGSNSMNLQEDKKIELDKAYDDTDLNSSRKKMIGMVRKKRLVIYDDDDDENIGNGDDKDKVNKKGNRKERENNERQGCKKEVEDNGIWQGCKNLEEVDNTRQGCKNLEGDDHAKQGCKKEMEDNNTRQGCKNLKENDTTHQYCQKPDEINSLATNPTNFSQEKSTIDSMKSHHIDEESLTKSLSTTTKLSESYNSTSLSCSHPKVLTNIEQEAKKLRRLKKLVEDKREKNTVTKNDMMMTLEVNESLDEKTCPICLCEFTEYIGKANICMHMFCFGCIKDWANVTNECPLCKRRFNSIEKYTLTEEKIDSVKVEFKQQVVEYDESLDEYEIDDRCYNCSTSNDPQLLLICDDCGFRCCHTYCCQPPLSSIPIEDWFCEYCIEAASSSSLVISIDQTNRQNRHNTNGNNRGNGRGRGRGRGRGNNTNAANTTQRTRGNRNNNTGMRTNQRGGVNQNITTQTTIQTITETTTTQDNNNNTTTQPITHTSTHVNDTTIQTTTHITTGGNNTTISITNNNPNTTNNNNPSNNSNNTTNTNTRISRRRRNNAWRRTRNNNNNNNGDYVPPDAFFDSLFRAIEDHSDIDDFESYSMPYCNTRARNSSTRNINPMIDNVNKGPSNINTLSLRSKVNNPNESNTQKNNGYNGISTNGNSGYGSGGINGNGGGYGNSGVNGNNNGNNRNLNSGSMSTRSQNKPTNQPIMSIFDLDEAIFNEKLYSKTKSGMEY